MDTSKIEELIKVKTAERDEIVRLTGEKQTKVQKIVDEYNAEAAQNQQEVLRITGMIDGYKELLAVGTDANS